MKQAILFLLLLFFSIRSTPQHSPEKTLVYNLTLDTLLAPDYYAVSISVAEFIQVERLGKKNIKSTLVSLDTLTGKLKGHLLSLGFSQRIDKSTVSEIDETSDYYRGPERKRFKATFSFRINTKDSVEYLFSNIDRKLVSGMHITPELHEATVEKAKQYLIPNGMKLADAYAAGIAQKMNQRITGSKYNIIFYDGGVNNHYNDFGKNFLIDYRDIKYRLSVSYTYTLADE